jgi:hypothetical protein
MQTLGHTLKLAMATYSYILSDLLFTIILSFDTVQPK